ncbi:hypothetical protein [Streptomyces sp. NBC_00582]|uniref:hypothetical protein n=1 Tax=Streptomyces sp. NBC_00582 TaxID=2975783 RepID=UPI002E8237F2|nr:hypothetical protein [Streptomyces sp. NBC_00582]WUB60846.1 hypothetical protein OG852_10835 [Streptomyces sp. NBC_00582]
MSLHAQQFFTEHLAMPFANSAVIGNTYYATPLPNSPLRLRIDFSRTIVANEYGGLRLAVLHPDKGELDAVALTFAEHGTFAHRDAARNTQPGQMSYGTIRVFEDRPDWVPWQGAHVANLRAAIEQYTAVWFPGAWKTETPARSRSRTARNVPTAPASSPATRTR